MSTPPAIEPTKITSFGTAKGFTKAACSGTLLSVLNRSYGYPMEAEEEASNTLAGGIVQHGYQCGQLWGAALAAGAQAFRLYGPGPRAEAAAVFAAGRLVESFRESNQETNCLELTETRMQKVTGVLRYMAKGGVIKCVRMAMRFAPVARQVIDDALAQEPPQIPQHGSCAALVARKMGASEQQVVMAAALAGGIGLSGGGCGALAAAIWITALQNPEEKVGLTAGDTKVGHTLEAFMAASDHQLECAEIVGRPFVSGADHMGYLQGGGCARIIEVLASVDALEKVA